MAHEIFGKRFVGARTPAWHNIGTVIPEGEKITVSKALKIGGLDYKYHSVPVGYTLPNGEFVGAGDRVMVLREPVPDDNEWVELGIVSSGYEYLQNDELAKGIDAISKETGWSFETIGALGRGGTTFMTLRTGKRSVFGDDYDTYLIVADGKAQGRALSITVSPVRVVCHNTLMASDSNSLMRVNIAHNAEVAKEFSFWLGFVGDLQKAQDAMFADLEKLAQVKIDDEAAKMIIAAAYPIPEKNVRARQAEELASLPGMTAEVRDAAMERLQPGIDAHEYWAKYMTRRQEAAFSLYERFNAGEEQGGQLEVETLRIVGKTAYAAVQAVTELVDWGGSGSAKIAAQASLFGDGAKAKQRAWDAAMSISA